MSQGVDVVSPRGEPTGELDRLAVAIERRPGLAFSIFVVVRAILWTIVPTLVFTNIPPDIIEGVAYGRDWQLGYWKHPPLPWLLVDITHRIFGGHDWALFMLSQLSAALASWAIWRLGCEIFTPLEAFAAVVVLDGYAAFTMDLSGFNHNILQLPMFALAGWSLYRAFIGGAIRDWLLVGVWFALAYYTKYEVIVLLFPALLFSVVAPKARECWRTAGPYIAAAVCAILIAPQLIWLAFVAHFSAIKFATDRATVEPSFIALLRGNGDFTVGALLYVVPILAMFLVTAGRIFPARAAVAVPSGRFARRYLAFLTFGPLVTALTIGFAMDRRMASGWAEQFWCFASLYLLAAFRPTIDSQALRRLFFGWCGVTGRYLVITVATGVFLVAPGGLFRSELPGRQFSDMVTNAWHKEVGAPPLPYIVGDFWVGGNVILYSPERPRMFEEGDPTHSPRVDPADIRRRGAVILFPPHAAMNQVPPAATDAPWLAEFPGAEPQPPFVVRSKTLRGEINWSIGWALLRPEKSGD